MPAAEETFVIGPATKDLSPDEIRWRDITLKNIDELIFTFFYDRKNHRYRISINYGEAYVDVTEKRGEAIFAFLKFVEELLGRRRKFRGSSDEETFADGPVNEDSFDFQEDEDFFDQDEEVIP